jgi:proliferating cell nuclear antigen
MRLTLADSKYLTDSISILSELVNDVRLKCDKNQIEVVAMDPANVAMVVFRLLSSAFTEYKVDEDVEICVSLDALKQVLRRSKPSDLLTLELDKEKNKLRVKIVGESSRTFNLALIDISDAEQKIPILKFPLTVNTNSSVFDEAIADMGIISESVIFNTEANKFVLRSESKLHNARVEVGSDAETVVVMEGTENVKSKYSLEYLKKMVKASKLTPSVKIQFGPSYPLRLDYTVKDKFQLVFLLAPRSDQ